MSEHFELRCFDCQKASPLVSTTREEIAVPDYDSMREQVGERASEAFRTFVSEHEEHRLEAVEV